MPGQILHALGEVLDLGKLAEVVLLVVPDFLALTVVEPSTAHKGRVTELQDQRTEIAAPGLVFLVRRPLAAPESILRLFVAVVHALGKADNFELSVGKALELHEETCT